MLLYYYSFNIPYHILTIQFSQENCWFSYTHILIYWYTCILIYLYTDIPVYSYYYSIYTYPPWFPAARLVAEVHARAGLDRYRCDTDYWLLYILNRENWINRWARLPLIIYRIIPELCPYNSTENEWTVIIHSSAAVIQFSIQQFFKRTYALNKWAPLPMGNISAAIHRIPFWPGQCIANGRFRRRLM